MAGHGGGAWKVAYADFVTAMMAFFLVMWITAQGKEVKESVAQYFRDPSSAVLKTPRPGPSIPSTKRGASSQAKRTRGKGIADPVAETASDKDAPGKTQMLAIYDGTRSTMGTLVAFSDDSGQLNDEGKKRLKNLLPSLLGKLNKIEIRGHASGRPLPSDSPFHDAWQLCYARCTAVMDYLVEEGVDRARIRLSQAGSFEHRATASDSDKPPPESRVEIYMLGEFAESPGAARESKDRQGK